MGQALLGLLAFAALAWLEVPRLRREGRTRELYAFWVLWALALAPGLWLSSGARLPPLNQGIAAVMHPLGRLLTEWLQ